MCSGREHVPFTKILWLKCIDTYVFRPWPPEIIGTLALPQIMASRQYFPLTSDINDVDDPKAAVSYGLRTDK